MPQDFDPFICRKAILADLGIHDSTLWKWITKGHFPKPSVLNEGMGRREITAWRASVYQARKDNLPQRLARPVAESAYTARREKTRRRLAAEAEQTESAPLLSAESKPAARGPVIRRPQQ